MKRVACALNSDLSWDPKKAASNRRKHGIRFEEASTVFPDRSRESNGTQIIRNRKRES